MAAEEMVALRYDVSAETRMEIYRYWTHSPAESFVIPLAHGYHSFFSFSFMKPLLTHSYPPLTATLPTCFLPITRLLTTREQRTLVTFDCFSSLAANGASFGERV